ncbi:MAG: LamG-like jellyroll fold domain-containing protein, partial [Acidimicrobiales bacterium]
VDPGTGGGPIEVRAVEGSDGPGIPVTLGSGAVVTVQADGSFLYDPGEAFEALGSDESAVDTFSFGVANGAGWSAEWVATVTVVGVNDRPTLEAVAPISLLGGSSSVVPLTAADPDRDRLTFALDGAVPGFVTLIDSDDGTATLSVSPSTGDGGSYEFGVTVTDDGQPALSSSVVVSVSVTTPLARVTDRLLVLYEFDEGSGSVVGDTSGTGASLDLTVTDPAAIEWGAGSLSVDSPTLLISPEPATKVSEAILESNEFTMEAWVTPIDVVQAGPARVLSLSADVLTRDMTLAQGDPDGVGGDHWTGRTRSTATTENGLPALSTPAATVITDEPTHLVLTRTDAGQITFYVDGVVVATATDAGTLTNWDTSFPLMLANEATGDRPWLGTYELVAVYGKALSAAEVDRNLRVGP